MRKTFKSTQPDNRTLEVDTVFTAPRLLIKDFDGDNKGFTFDKADAPALALAVLEAAGYMEGDRDGSTLSHFAIAKTNLRWGIRKQADAAAEAEAQAELEAEAFNLYRAYMAVHEPMNAIGGWSMLSEQTKEVWLAVAQKAREMRAEK